MVVVPGVELRIAVVMQTAPEDFLQFIGNFRIPSVEGVPDGSSSEVLIPWEKRTR